MQWVCMCVSETLGRVVADLWWHELLACRGIRFLVQRQLTDGDWEQESIMGVFNRTTGITYANYRNAFPLWALGRYNTEYVHGPFGGHAQ